MEFESEALPLASSAWTEDWRSESAALMHISQTLSAFAEGRWMGSLLVQQLPDDTIALSNLSTVLPLSPDQQHAVRTQLLRQSVLMSQVASPRYVRYLVDTRDVCVVQALAAAGFHSGGQVTKWRLLPKTPNVSRPAPAGFGFYGIDAAELQQRPSWNFIPLSSSQLSEPHYTVSKDTLRGLLNNTLQHSIDLPQLPLPTADQLLRLWELSRSTIRITLAVRNGSPAGLMATSLVDEDGDGHGTELLIEYVGVLPDMRQNGIASALLTTGIRDMIPPHHVTAFAGSENGPAGGLYRRRGFTSRDTLCVWIAS